MKLTKAEYGLLDELNQGKELLVKDLNKRALVTAAWMAGKGLLKSREWDKGRVVASALGLRSHAYGPRSC